MTGSGLCPCAGPREECGVFGIYGHPDAGRMAYLGLYALQHRGQESAGIVASDGCTVVSEHGSGLAADVITEAKLATLSGHLAIGHVRYSTTGSTSPKNVQPFMVNYSRGTIAIGHNGNLTNARILRDELEAYGHIFQTTMDSEIIVHMLAKPSYANLEDALVDVFARLEGSFSLVMTDGSQVIGARDPWGIRPLCIGKLGGAYVLASETCALDLMQASYVRDVEPGEVVFLNESGLRSVRFAESGRRAHCIFEYIYFGRPDSLVFGHNVHMVRKNLGATLAREAPADADLVIAIPDSGNSAALGYAHESGLPYDSGFTRNHYIGRTFIQPSQFIRDFSVRIKLNPIRNVVAG